MATPRVISNRARQDAALSSAWCRAILMDAGIEKRAAEFARSERDMQLDDEICYCYHVSLRKLANFSRRVKPAHPSQMTQCLGAGTGCGWCIPFLIKIAQNPDAFPVEGMSRDVYAEKRQAYRASGEPKNAFTNGHG